MCIILYKPAGENLPSKSIINNCFNNNFDGAGIMWNDGEKVRIEKGFMTVTELHKALKQLKTITDIKNTELVLHFRYATHGTITESNCHPFPITNNIKSLQKISLEVDEAIAHNGIISFCSDKNNLLSDTQIFIKDYLSYIPDLKNDAILALIEHATNSKFAIMDKNNVRLVGDFIYNKGIYYSNTGFKKSKYKYSKFTAIDFDDDFEDYNIYNDEHVDKYKLTKEDYKALAELEKESGMI